MGRKVIIKIDDKEILAELNTTITADKIWDALPIESVGNLWGEEIYFSTNINASIDNTSKVVVDIGDLGFWPPNNAFCIFYGKTPLSTDEEIKAASAVNIIGKLISKPEELMSISDNCIIQVVKDIE